MKKRTFFLMVLFAFGVFICVICGAAPAYAGQNGSSTSTAAPIGGQPAVSASPASSMAAGGSPQTVKKFFLDPKDMRVSFDFQNASVVDVIRMIAKVSDMNVLIGSNVKGTVTMKMKNVPLKNILSLILEAYSLGMIKKDGIYYINSTGTIASVVSAEKKARAISEHKVTRLIPVNYVSATGLISKVKSVLSSQGKVIYDKSLHSLLITDIPNHVAKAVKLVKMLDKRTPEVEIVAKMVEVNKSYSNQLGINWSGSYSAPAPTSSNAAVSPNFFSAETTGTPSGPGPGTFAVGILNSYASINATLQALESLSKAKTIASPSVIVLNNQAATMSKTVSSSFILPATTPGAVGTMQTIAVPISLNVTPHIMANGMVKLTINANNSTIVPPPQGVTGAAISQNTENITSNVIIKNRQTVVIGGVYTTNKSVATGGIPGLMSIPLLGWLFKYRSINYTKDELFIFITPKIIKG
jgi:type IV pilus assembly protein PilQ